MRNAFMLDATASRSLCASTNAVLYWTSRSRAKASMLLPFTSLQNSATASRYVLSGSLCQANSVPEVIEKSRAHALQLQRGHTGLPSVSGQRRRRNTFSTPRPDMRMILAQLSERAVGREQKMLRHE